MVKVSGQDRRICSLILGDKGRFCLVYDSYLTCGAGFSKAVSEALAVKGQFEAVKFGMQQGTILCKKSCFGQDVNNTK